MKYTPSAYMMLEDVFFLKYMNPKKKRFWFFLVILSDPENIGEEHLPPPQKSSTHNDTTIAVFGGWDGCISTHPCITE